MADGATDVLARRGHRPLDPELAVTALNTAPGPNTVITDTDWDTFHPVFTTQRPSPLLQEFEPESAPSSGEPDWPRRLGGLPRAERIRTLRDLVRAEVGAVLAHPAPQSLDPDRAFRELGMDSMTAVELRNRLNGRTGLAFGPALVFDHPTIDELVDLVDEQLRESEVDVGGAELDRIGALIRDCPDEARDVLRQRLANLVATIDKMSTQDEGRNAALLADAADDELFAFINDELNS